MIEAGGGVGGGMFEEASGLPRPSKYTGLTYLDPLMKSTSEEEFSMRNSSSSVTSPGYYSDRSSSNPMSFEGMPSSPYASSPWSHTPGTASLLTNPFSKDPSDAAVEISRANEDLFPPGTGLIGSLVREEGHIYSLAAVGDLLYTGSDSKNIRVWKNQQEHSGFKSTSGLVKAIVISGDRIFTGHQDGKIRVWKVSPKNPKVHKRAGTLPRLKDFLKSSMKPSNYVEARRRGGRSAVWIRHSDAVSCLSLNEDQGLLYSGSWDRTFKVWRISDSKCLESVSAHEDAVNAVVAGLDGLVFTGSADGTVKVWRRELAAKGGTRHAAVQTLLRQECAVTSLVVSALAGIVYCGSSDGVVNFWERERGMAHGGALKGHKMAVLCLAAAGSLLFSGSADKTICVWRRDAGVHTCLSVLTGHAGPVKCLAVEAEASSEAAGRPPGKATMWVVYSGSLDKSVKVWKVAEPPPLQQLQKGMDVYENEAAPQYDMY